MPSGFVSVFTVAAGTGKLVRRAAYNARKTVMVERTGRRYRPRALDDHVGGGLVLPPASQSLGTHFAQYWNRLDLTIKTGGVAALDLILGLPREDELDQSECVRMLEDFIAPLIANGHAVQWDIHSLPREAEMGRFRHAHLLVSLFSPDHYGRLRRLQTQWTPVYRMTQVDRKRSDTLPDWRSLWTSVQHRFFQARGMANLRVPPDVGFPEVSWRRGRHVDRSDRLALEAERDERRHHLAQAETLLAEVTKRSLFFSNGELISLLKSIFPRDMPVDIEAKTGALLASAVPLTSIGDPLYGTGESLSVAHGILRIAERLASSSNFIEAHGGIDEVSGWQVDEHIVQHCLGAERLAVIGAAGSVAWSGPDDAHDRGPFPLQSLIESYRAAGVASTIIVPDLASRWSARQVLEDRRIRCQSISALENVVNASRHADTGRLVIAIDAQKLADRSMARLLEYVDLRDDKLILVYDVNALSGMRNWLSVAILERHAYPSVLVDRSVPAQHWHRFSWSRLALEFERVAPFTLIGYFDHYRLLAFSRPPSSSVGLQASQVVVGSEQAAAAMRKLILARQLGRAERLAVEPCLELAGHPPLLAGDPVCLTRDFSSATPLLLGAQGQIVRINAGEDNVLLQWGNGLTTVFPLEADLPLVHDGAVSLRFACAAADHRARTGVDGRSFGRQLVCLNEGAFAEELLRLSASLGGLAVAVDPEVAKNCDELVELLRAQRPHGIGGALVDKVIQMGELSYLPSLAPTPTGFGSAAEMTSPARKAATPDPQLDAKAALAVPVSGMDGEVIPIPQAPDGDGDLNGNIGWSVELDVEPDAATTESHEDDFSDAYASEDGNDYADDDYEQAEDEIGDDELGFEDDPDPS